MAVVLFGAGLVLWAALPNLAVTGMILIIAAIVNGWRLARWLGDETWPDG